MEKKNSSPQYNPQEIETRWQSTWQNKSVFHLDEHSAIENHKKFYILEMFPYPSGRIHIGHARNYLLGDVLARSYRMKGYKVLYPMGFDAFGLPAENAALKAGVHPKNWTYDNIDAMKKSLMRIGLSYDWSKQIITCDPNFFVHEQKIFIEMFKKGLVYRKKAPVNYCPNCQTVLANEQVENSLCWRCQSKVETKDLEQWFIRVTAYAEELYQGLDKLVGKWPDTVINTQRSWIGRSQGVEVLFDVLSEEKTSSPMDPLRIFTTRLDTIFGVSFIAISPEHPMAQRLIAAPFKEAGESFIKQFKLDKITLDINSLQTKEGFFTGSYAKHPLTDQKIPIYLANFVFMDYGTGAIMGVPGHDTRDFEFAQLYQLPIISVVGNKEKSALPDIAHLKPYLGDGVIQNSSSFNGLKNTQALVEIFRLLQQAGRAEKATYFKIRDWLVSRQRYWGCPIPLLKCVENGHGYQPVPEEQLPLSLPTDAVFSNTGGFALSNHPSWSKTICPICGGKAVRETDTMDGFMESSWYFLRYASPNYKNGMIDPHHMWLLPVDHYIGGAEHSTKHLIYSRFFTKMLRDFSILPKTFDEPFCRLQNQGMVLKDAYRCETHDYLYPEELITLQDGQVICKHCRQKVLKLRQMKMSKSLKNVIEPSSLIEKYGADTTRLFCLFAAPPESVLEWNDDGVEGCYRFLGRVYRLVIKYNELPKNTRLTNQSLGQEEVILQRKTHQTIKKVLQDIFDRNQYNTAIAALMELSNTITTQIDKSDQQSACLKEAIETLIALLNPMAPHLCEELWSMLGHTNLLAHGPFPTYNEQLAQEQEFKIGVQINGKIRAELIVSIDTTEQDVLALALADKKIKTHTDGKSIRKFVYVRGKLLSLVVA